MNGKLFVVLSMLATSAFSGTYYWKPTAAGGTYAEASNWTSGAVPAAGNTYCVTNGVTNPFAQDTTALKGTLDLGGATQTFTADIDSVFASGGTVRNGYYKMTNKGAWNSRDGYKFYIDKGAKVDVTGRLYLTDGEKLGDFTLYVKNGAELNLKNTSDNQLGRYKTNWYSIYVQDGSRLTAKTLRVGWDTNGRGRLHVKNESEAILSGMLKIGGRDSGNNIGQADIQILTGSRLQAKNGIGYAYSEKAPADNQTLTVSGNSILETKSIAPGDATRNDYNFFFNFNDATFVPNTAGVNLFDDSKSKNKPSFHITGGMLTVSNAVGKVTVGSVVDGAGGFCLTGGEDLEFTAAPTYTGATTVKEGTLTYTGNATTALTVKDGATFVYTKDLAFASNKISLESGATLSMDVEIVEDEFKAAMLAVTGAVNLDGVNLVPTGLKGWSDVEVAVMTATGEITGTPVLPEGLKYDIESEGGTNTLSIMDENFTPVAKRPIFAEWTGAGTDPTDYTDPANWICYNAAEEVVAGAVPRFYTIVRVYGNTSFTYPAAVAEAFPLAGMAVTDNVTLTGDCDWRYFGAFDYPENGCRIDLNGHALDAEIPADGALTVVGSGKIVVDVPAKTVYDTTKVFGSPACGFDKKGAGELVIHLTDAEQAGGRALSIAAGKVTLKNETGAALTNCFDVAATGIDGTLDLGGTVQTFSADPDAIFGNGALVVNGTLSLTSKADWSDEGKTVTFGTNMTITCAACLDNGGVTGTSTLNFKDGCVCTFTITSDHYLGRFVSSDSNAYKINVWAGARVNFSGNVRIGCGTRGRASVTVNNATLYTPKKLQLANRANGDVNGEGYLTVKNGGYVECSDVTIAESDKKDGKAEISVENSTLKTGQIYFVHTGNNNKASCKFSNATLIPLRGNTNLFRDIAPEITGGTLAVNVDVPNRTVKVESGLTGKGGLELLGGGTLVFKVAPTYTGATTITDGTLILGGLDHGSTALTVAANGTYATDTDDTWGTITFAEGAKDAQVSTAKESVTLTATDAIVGRPVLPTHYDWRYRETEASKILTVYYRSGFMLFLR